MVCVRLGVDDVGGYGIIYQCSKLCLFVAAGKYWVEVGLVPPLLTAYDALWLQVV